MDGCVVCAGVCVTCAVWPGMHCTCGKRGWRPGRRRQRCLRWCGSGHSAGLMGPGLAGLCGWRSRAAQTMSTAHPATPRRTPLGHWQAGLAADLDCAVVSAVIIVLDDAHQDRPLLAFAMTDPACQRRGIGRWLIEESIRRLDGIGVKELHLAVTRSNPAFALYQRLGFEVVPALQPSPAPEAPGRSL